MVFDLIPEAIQGWIITFGIGGFVAWLSHQAYCLRQNRKRTWRLEKAFILSMKLTAKLTRRAHSNDQEIIEDVNDIEKFVNIVLEPDANKDEKSLFR